MGLLPGPANFSQDEIDALRRVLLQSSNLRGLLGIVSTYAPDTMLNLRGLFAHANINGMMTNGSGGNLGAQSPINNFNNLAYSMATTIDRAPYSPDANGNIRVKGIYDSPPNIMDLPNMTLSQVLGRLSSMGLMAK